MENDDSRNEIHIVNSFLDYNTEFDVYKHHEAQKCLQSKSVYDTLFTRVGDVSFATKSRDFVGTLLDIYRGWRPMVERVLTMWNIMHHQMMHCILTTSTVTMVVSHIYFEWFLAFETRLE